MKWQIQRVSPEDASVFLVNPETGTTRLISVPGAEAAWIEQGHLMIRSSTGYLWEVEPDSGSRRRVFP